jgi:nitrate reductase NapAB chaperone NapD
VSVYGSQLFGVELSQVEAWEKQR